MAGLPADRDDPTQDLEERTRDDLVWAASAALGERDASVLDLHLRHGLAAGEIAEALAVTPNHAHQLLFRLKDRLGAAIRSWVLWRRGAPRCTDLAAALAGADITAFGADAVRVIGRHADGCEACTADRDEVLAPDRLFAAVPIALAPPALKARAAGAIAADGVPMAADVEPDPAVGGRTPGRGGAARRRPRIGALVAGGVALVVVVVAVVVGIANRAGDEDAGVATVGTDAPTTATSDGSETTSTTTTERARTTVGALPPTAAPDPTPRETTASSPTATTQPPPPEGPPPEEPPPEPPPEIGGFRVTLDPAGCGSAGSEPGSVVAWAASGGTEHTIQSPNGSTIPVGASGEEFFCPHQPGTWTFTVTGPGGTTAQDATVGDFR